MHSVVKNMLFLNKKVIDILSKICYIRSMPEQNKKAKQK